MAKLALTPGCPAGIGPEILPAALKLARLPKDITLIWCASPALFLKYDKTATRQGQTILTVSGYTIECTAKDEDDRALLVKPGTVDTNALAAQKQALDDAISLAKQNKVQGIVTGPIRKAALADVNGIRFDGQTEYLHHFLAADKEPPTMCFAGADFLLGLATIHVPLKDVAAKITCQLLESHIRRLDSHLKGQANITVLGLNPHAGENGLIGDEEVRVVIPCIKKLNQEGFRITGQVAADGFCAHMQNTPQAVLAMYHSQGLAPCELLCKGIAVNMTLGLTIARTSPAHGTADDLAGTGKADPASLVKALEVCAQCV